MLTHLSTAFNQISDPVDDVDLTVLREERNGLSGCPRIAFDPQFLQFALESCTLSRIAPFFGCSPSTVRRRALEYGLLEPGESPYRDIHQNGGITHIWIGVKRRTRMSNLTDAQLVNAIHQILRSFPSYGRRMIDGHLRACGIRVSQKRISASYTRIRGLPSAFHRRIKRRRYNVAGVNSLWHHDGYHGQFYSFVHDNVPKFYKPRVDPLEDCGPRVYGWEVEAYHRSTRAQQ
jgi:hypothetical protein